MNLELRNKTIELPNHKIYPRLEDLFHGINALPGIEVTSSTPLNGRMRYNAFIIFFKVTSSQGLFFLTRCCDKRYWQYGDKWDIVLEVGDSMYNDGTPPITYKLQTTWRRDINQLYDEITDLYINMNYHINHQNFMSGYNLNIDDFDVVDPIVENRNDKINDILWT